MQQGSMYATGANPTLVQNDEHVLVKGHRPGHSIVSAYEWRMGFDTVPGYVSQHQRVVESCTLQVAGGSAFMLSRILMGNVTAHMVVRGAINNIVESGVLHAAAALYHVP